MRNYLFIALALTGACKWTDFDDLEDTTWVRSTQDPENGGTDYPVAIVDVSTSASGGTIAVLADNSPTYQTVAYNSKGTDTVGAAVKLTMHQIGALADNPVFVADSGRIGLVERANTGNSYIAFYGLATAPAGFEFASVTQPAPSPDAAVLIPNATTGSSDLVFAAGNTIYTVPAAGGAPVGCSGVDNNNMPLAVAALAAQDSTLWAWTKTGALISFPISALTPCMGGNLPAPGANAFVPAAPFAPGGGAHIYISGNFKILAATPAGSTTGSIFVVDSNFTQVGSTMTIEGMKSTAFGDFSLGQYLVVGVPARNVDGVAAGEVDMFGFTSLTGTLETTPELSLHDAQPESGQELGRVVSTMLFNGERILVVGGKDEIFAYYKTSLYDHLP